jgi:hypothetical protein
MAQPRFKADPYDNGNVYAFPPARPASDEASAALDLVYQAADIFRGLQDRARETEMRAQSLCKVASEKVRLAEMRAQAAEQAYRDLMNAVDRKLQDASSALEQAQASISVQVDQRTAAEIRTHKAESDARDAKRALVRVEQAIRERLLK